MLSYSMLTMRPILAPLSAVAAAMIAALGSLLGLLRSFGRPALSRHPALISSEPCSATAPGSASAPCPATTPSSTTAPGSVNAHHSVEAPGAAKAPGLVRSACYTCYFVLRFPLFLIYALPRSLLWPRRRSIMSLPWFRIRPRHVFVVAALPWFCHGQAGFAIGLPLSSALLSWPHPHCQSATFSSRCQSVPDCPCYPTPDFGNES